MIQADMFSGSELSRDAAQLPPELLARLRRAGITLERTTYNDYYGDWIYHLRADWRGRGASTITKTRAGVEALLTAMERTDGA